MDGQSSTDRVTRTLIAAVILGGICFSYMSLSSRYLDVDHHQRKRTTRTAPPKDTPIADESILEYFPKTSWVRHAKKSFRDKGQYLFLDEVKETVLLKRGQNDAAGVAVDLKPIAWVWKSEDPGERPIIATADSARLNLSKKFSFENSSDGSAAGRIVSGWLTGNVTIAGPKGLQITGKEFFIDETSMKLKSRHPVDFLFDGHSGRAYGGIEIDLERKSEHDKGLTSISGMRFVRLNGKVNCSLKFDGDRRNQPTTRLEIDSPSGFVFDFKNNIGVFRGKLGGGNYKKTDVLVKRMTDGEPDEMWCPLLTVEFHPKINPETGQLRDNGLRLGRVTATGSSNRIVRYKSPEHGVAAGMMQLDYEDGARQLDMYGKIRRRSASAQKNHSPNTNQLVRIIQGGKILRVPHVRVLHGKGMGVERIECHGVGSITPHEKVAQSKTNADQSETVAAAARWNRQLTVQRAVDGATHVISLDGGATVKLPEQQMAMTARQIELTILTPTPPEDTRKSPAGDEFSLNMTDAKPEKLIARGDVNIRSPQVSGELKEQLTVYFHESDAIAKNNISVISRPKELSPSTQDDLALRNVLDDEDQGHSTFFAKEMTAHVVLPEDKNSEQKWSLVRLAGDVVVEHQGATPDERYTASGNTFKAKNGLGNKADIQLFGSPAIISSTMGNTRGLRIDLHQAQGEAEINGSGRLRLIIDQSFDGRPLPSPIPVDIYWDDRMKVRGKEAHFVGEIRIVADGVRYAPNDMQNHNTEILTPELKVFFLKALNLTGANTPAAHGNSSGSPELERIQCVGRTRIHQESFTDGEMDGLLDAEMVDLAIRPDTGDFSAIGEGWIESTSTNTSRKNLQPEIGMRVQANAPTEIGKSPFTRVKIKFIERMEGNLHRREAHLRHRVNIAFAPVRNLDDKLDLELIPAEKMPPDSRTLQAEAVDIVAIPGKDGESFSITAVGNATLESLEISGDADRITYDRSKSQIVLTGEDGRLVNGRHRPRGSNQFSVLNGPWYQYNLETGQLRSQNTFVNIEER